MEDTSESTLDEKEMQQSVQAGFRNSIKHVKYREGTVKLAFGRHAATERIIHISSADRGKSCGCHCPACSEELLAKQGDALAWHFAHASGGQCRDAVSASISSWLAQILNDGQGITLPEVSFKWGGDTIKTKGPTEPVKVVKAFISQEAPGWPFYVITEVETALGVIPLRIIPHAVQKPNLPDASSCKQEDISTFVIDMSDSLRILTSSNSEDVPDELWMSSHLLSQAPRRWIWSQKSDKLYEKHVHTRLGAAIRVLSTPSPRPRDLNFIENTMKLPIVEQSFLLNKDIEGEDHLSLLKRDWRMLFIHDMIVKPLSDNKDKAPVFAAGFSSKEIGDWIRARRLDRVPYAVNRDLTSYDIFELRYRYKGWRPAFNITQDYIYHLWRQGYLSAKPWKDTLRHKTPGPIDHAMSGRQFPFWRPSDNFSSLVRKSVV